MKHTTAKILLAVAFICVSIFAAGNEKRLRVDFAGCAEVSAGPTCELGESHRLVLWLDVAHADHVMLTFGSRRLHPETVTAVAGGQRLDLRVPADAGHLIVAVGRGADRQTFALPLTTRQRGHNATRADELLNAGDYDSALALVEQALPGAQAAERGELLRTRGRIFLRRGDSVAAQQALVASIDASREAGRRFTSIITANALAFSLMHASRDFGAARNLIESFEPTADGYAEAVYFRNHDLGLVAFNSGDARNALRHLGAAASQARRVGWQRRALNSESILALQLQQLGRRERAAALLERWREALPDDLPGCERAHYYTNLGWSALLMLDSGATSRDPATDLATAATLSDEHCDDNARANARINLALAHYHKGAYDAAEAMLQGARDETRTPNLGLVLWSEDIAARIALARGRLEDSLARYEALEDLAAATLSPSARWRAAIGRARVFVAMGEHERAVAAFAAADTQLDSDLLRIPLDSGRETLLAARAEALSHHLDLLLAMGLHDDAFDLVRRSHSRSLRAVHLPQRLASLTPERRALWDGAMARYRELGADLSQDDGVSWMLPADELARRQQRREEGALRLRSILDDALSALDRPAEDQPALHLADGELYLHLAPLVKGWALFVHDGTTLAVQISACDQTETAALATCLLGEVADRIARASALRIAAVGELARTDFHALDVDGTTLGARLPVIYTAGLPRDGSSTAVHGRALLIADPRNDLRQARREVATVEALLSASGRWSAQVIAGDSARADDVQALLAHSDLFHYAGHARFAGDGGWQSTLALAGESRLDVADILALGNSPSLVVLSGCETAGAKRSDSVQQFGLAHAFLAGGADGVIATSRPVADRSAYLLVSEFYRSWTDGQPARIAFNKAQQSLRTRHADPDWAAFRLMEP